MEVFSLFNILNVLGQISFMGILSAGFCIVIISGCIDLSVGSIMSFSGVVFTLLLNEGFPVLAAGAVSVMLAALIGILNGILVSAGKINPIITTFLTMNVIQGIANLISSGAPVNIKNNVVDTTKTLSIIGIPISFVIMTGIIILLHLFLMHTYPGKYIYAVGNNPQSCINAGINIRLVKTEAFMISGLLSGIAGIMITLRLGTGIPNIGVGYEFTGLVIMALSAIPMSGGRGRMWNVIIGTVLYGMVSSWMVIANINIYVQDVVWGCFVFAVAYLRECITSGKKSWEKYR